MSRYQSASQTGTGEAPKVEEWTVHEVASFVTDNICTNFAVALKNLRVDGTDFAANIKEGEFNAEDFCGDVNLTLDERTRKMFSRRVNAVLKKQNKLPLPL